jgi:hypothetical protein
LVLSLARSDIENTRENKKEIKKNKRLKTRHQNLNYLSLATPQFMFLRIQSREEKPAWDLTVMIWQTLLQRLLGIKKEYDGLMTEKSSSKKALLLLLILVSFPIKITGNNWEEIWSFALLKNNTQKQYGVTPHNNNNTGPLGRTANLLEDRLVNILFQFRYSWAKAFC